MTIVPISTLGTLDQALYDYLTDNHATRDTLSEIVARYITTQGYVHTADVLTTVEKFTHTLTN